MKKITIVTGTRAEFGVLRPLIEKIYKENAFELQIVATAMHLSPEFGSTVDEIEEAGFEIAKKVECLLSSDTGTGVAKTMGLAMIGFADAFKELEPDLLIILGDRTEMLAAASTAMTLNIPIAHIHGGETTEGAYDESIRHAITKMSYWHFPATEAYRKRIIQLGEDPNRVFNVGAMGIDSITNRKLLTKEEFEKSIGFSLGQSNILVTYHPVTLEDNTSKKQFQVILNSLLKLKDTKFIFTHANSDKNGRIINEMIKQFVRDHQDIAIDFQSLGQLRYLSALKHVDAVVGNSSSGIVEVPYFNIPTINIGDRQKGRVASESVVHAAPNADSIEKALEKAFDHSFRRKIKDQEQLFGHGNAAEKIYSILSEPMGDLKKEFYNLNF